MRRHAAPRILRTSKTLFEGPGRALWITAQGSFVDPRVRPIKLQSGIGYVASRLTAGTIIPVAVEYPFWDQRTPEALIRYGKPLDLGERHGLDGREWTCRIEEALTAAQDALAAESVCRDPALFEMLIAGTVGVGGAYDRWRRWRSWLCGRRFEPSHASIYPAVEQERIHI